MLLSLFEIKRTPFTNTHTQIHQISCSIRQKALTHGTTHECTHIQPGISRGARKMILVGRDGGGGMKTFLFEDISLGIISARWWATWEKRFLKQQEGALVSLTGWFLNISKVNVTLEEKNWFNKTLAALRCGPAADPDPWTSWLRGNKSSESSH